ncbi:MAG TPA: daunorubicin/doxorubicin resistance ABC transporter ATP-binding protein DrrA, partial [Actinobacteria bacterium]|nr:daunorubicin/doxorubicin resistance ABC transporter ATP-binding protein DrrA [Actinomycetota bacterium]
ATLPAAAQALAALSESEPTIDEVDRRVTVPVSGGSTVLVDVVRGLDSAGVALEDLSLRRPTLDDVFLSLTGRTAEDEEDSATKGRGKSKKKEASA